MPSLLPLFLTFLPLFALSVSTAQVLNFNFPTFGYENYSNLILSGSSGMTSDALQVTFDSGRNDSRKYYNMGRIMYRPTLKLWDSDYNYTASFSTSFELNMQPLENTANENRSLGGGMAFIMVDPSATYCPPNSSQDCWGKWLGLFNSQTNGSKNPFMVAIEFDTFKDSFDPDGNHVGIDLNSIVSNKTAPTNINLSNGNTSVWVDYDGRAKFLEVRLAKGNESVKPVYSTLSVELDLSKHLPQEIILGFSGSTGSYFETHCVLRWNFTTTHGIPVKKNAGRLNVGLKVGLPAAALALLLMAMALVMTHRAGLKRLEKKWPDLTYGPRKFIYKELKKATNNFSTKNVLGQGGFGTVYGGILSPDNTPVAVKRVSPQSKQGEQEFLAEVTTIGRLRHKNLLPLLGWYHDLKGEDLLLVYDYMPNGSLDKWLFTDQKDVFLDWHLRCKIVHGLGRALLYLHEEWEQVVVHRDVKASNVMLDSEYNARLGDFGLARLIKDQDGAETTRIAGTVGYMAPECVQTGIVTPESDVYSFGAVALEVACGKRPYAKETGFLAHWVWQLQKEGRLLGAADGRLEGAYDEDEMKRLLMAGLACCSPDPRSRPSMRKVLQSLYKDGPLPRVADSRSANDSISVDFDFASCSLLSSISSSFPPPPPSTPSTSETRLLTTSSLSDSSGMMAISQMVGR